MTAELRLLASFVGVASPRPGDLGLEPALGCRLGTGFLISGLLCHYWLDGRIWTRRARRLAAA